MTKAKTRGLKRKIRNFLVQMEEVAEEARVFPVPLHGDNYWHLHFPSQQHFIDAQATPFTVRRLAVQRFIDQAHQLALLAPPTEITRVVVAITLPRIVQSQIIVFFDQDYDRTFFERDTQAKRWTLIEDKSLCRAWNLALPTGFTERGYEEEMRDEDGFRKSKIWFIGQLD